MEDKHIFIDLPDDVEYLVTKDIVKKGTPISLKRSFDAEICQLFARQANIPGAEEISISMTLTPFQDGIDVTIIFKASLIRQCVISSEEFLDHYSEQQQVQLLLPRQYASYQARLESDDAFSDSQLDENDPELLDLDGVPIISLSLELLAVSLDPFPRKQDATLKSDFLGESHEVESQTNRPFANLEELLKNKANSS